MSESNNNFGLSSEIDIHDGVDSLRKAIKSLGEAGIGKSLWCMVGPDDAKKLLVDGNYIGQSTKGSCKSIARDIKNGQWNPFLSVIRVSPGFYREDGFNRMKALSESGIGHKLLMEFKVVPEGTFAHPSADSGSKRDAADKANALKFSVDKKREMPILRTVSKILGYPHGAKSVEDAIPFWESIIDHVRLSLKMQDVAAAGYGDSTPPRLKSPMLRIASVASVLQSMAGLDPNEPFQLLLRASNGSSDGSPTALRRLMHNAVGKKMSNDREKKETACQIINLIKTGSSKLLDKYNELPSEMSKLRKDEGTAE